MALKVFVDRMSQPSRAIVIFCKVNEIDFEENGIQLFKGEHKKPEFLEINPMGQVPAISHGDLYLFESHAILRYLACAFPGVADHWYPTDLKTRAKVDSVLDWHHTNLRRGAATYIQRTALACFFGNQPNPAATAEAQKTLTASLLKLESFWLNGDGKFLLGGSQPSIADISLVCEITMLELLEENECKRILAPHKKVLQWIEDTRIATNPHFDEVHATLLESKARINKLSETNLSTIRSMLSS